MESGRQPSPPLSRRDSSYGQEQRANRPLRTSSTASSSQQPNTHGSVQATEALRDLLNLGDGTPLPISRFSTPSEGTARPAKRWSGGSSAFAGSSSRGGDSDAKRRSLPAESGAIRRMSLTPPIAADQYSAPHHYRSLYDTAGNVEPERLQALRALESQFEERRRSQGLTPARTSDPLPGRQPADGRFTDGTMTELGPAAAAAVAAPPPDFAMRRGPSDATSRSKPKPPPMHASRALTEFFTISYLILFAILGTLARLGLQWLTFYPGAPVVLGVLWANFGGSLIMGLLAEDRQLFRHAVGAAKRPDEEANVENMEGKGEQATSAAKAEHLKVKKTIPLYIGLATGFCGSFTSFSSFMRDVFFALSNDLPTPINHPYTGAGPIATTSTVSRNGGYSFMATLAVIILTVGLCLASLIFGAHAAAALHPYTPSLPSGLVRRFLDPTAALLGWGCWLGAVFMAIWPPDRPSGPVSHGSWTSETWRGQAVFALVFAPLGCLIRFYASAKLNGIMPSFPLGTFAVNIFGTAVLAMAYDLQHVPFNSVSALIGGGRVGCQVLQGIMDGFCGTLTTVSTWVAELNALRRWHAYVYGLSSIASALALLLIIMGSVRWTIGFSTPACVT